MAAFYFSQLIIEACIGYYPTIVLRIINQHIIIKNNVMYTYEYYMHNNIIMICQENNSLILIIKKIILYNHIKPKNPLLLKVFGMNHIAG